MLLRELVNLGKTCKVCGSTDPKNISVRTIWDERPKNVDIKDDSLIFTVGITDNCYELFKFYLDDHKADRKIHNPDHLSQMFCNNFMFKISCPKCNVYSFESSTITYHAMGGLISDVYIDSEEISLEDDGECYRLKNMVHTDKIILSYDGQSRNGKIEFPFMTLKDFPIRNKAKMLKKIRTLLLLS